MDNQYTIPSIIQIKKSIPSHCFTSNVSLSLYFLFRDLFLVVGNISIMHYLYTNTYISIFYVIYPFYAFLQGTIFMGLFVIGHDAGHYSFSIYPTLNYFVGLLTHSMIMTPYTPWQLTHQKHHKNTGHIDNDEIFKPIRKSVSVGKFIKNRNLIDYNFLYGFAWWVYLLLGFAPNHSFMYHYNPFSSIMYQKCIEVIGSLFGLLLNYFIIYKCVQYTSFFEVFLLYFIPLVIFSFWLVVITFLHHNDTENIKWHSGNKWSYVIGNLNSVDRSYGFIIDNLIHNIGTHQIHHLFPIIPHYYLQDATNAFRLTYPLLTKYNKNNNFVSEFNKNLSNYKKKHIINDNCDEVII